MLHSTCYIRAMQMNLASIAKHSDAQVQQARADLVAAVRAARAAGLTQAEIARQIGRSQPEVSRLLKFRGVTPLARTLREHADEVKRLVGSQGGRDVRVFGSVATGVDGPDSDVDLLFTMVEPMSLMQLASLEQRVQELLGVPVDLVPDTNLRPGLRDRVLTEAAPL